jgi:transcriptional regulator with PAS, ATPase and Fis domain
MVPLSKRKDDIPLLVNSFLKNISKSMGKDILSIDDKVLDLFMKYHWPGNVRELQNVLERMINIADANMLTFDLVPCDILDALQAEDVEYEIEPFGRMERESITKLIASNLTKKDIAKKLGISRSTLYRKLDRYQFETK